MMVESIPPGEATIGAVGINDQGPDEGGFDSDERTTLILAITTRRYAIVCEACGACAGGFTAGKEEDSGSAG